MKHKEIEVAEGICSECQRPTRFKIEDFGIGSYEYWGARGVHHDYQWTSECCDAPPVDNTLNITIHEPDYDAILEARRERTS